MGNVRKIHNWILKLDYNSKTKYINEINQLRARKRDILRIMREMNKNIESKSSKESILNKMARLKIDNDAKIEILSNHISGSSELEPL